MKILELTPHRITLRDCAISLWLSAAGLALGGFVTIAQGKLTTLTCHRGLAPQSQCQLSQFGVLGIGSSQQSLNDLQEASVDTHSSSKGGRTYAVVFPSSQGTIQLTHYSNNQQEQEAIASQINAFVKNPHQLGLQIQQDDRLGMSLLGGLLVGAGSIFITACRITHCDLDRTTGKLRIARWGIRGTQVREYPLHQVVSVNLDTRIRKYKGRLHTSYRISFRLLHGEEVHLNRFYAEDRQRSEVAFALSRFLAARPVNTRETEAIDLCAKALRSKDLYLDKPHLDEAETLYRLGMAQYRQHQTQEAGINLKQARDLFRTQHNTQRVTEIQTVLWQLGLE